MTLTLNPAIQNIASAHHLSLVNICVRFLRNPSRGSRVTERKRKKSYDLWPLSMTLNPVIRNIASAYRLSLVNICVRFLRNPSRGSRVTERKGKKVIWPLAPKYDIDLESSHPKHYFCTASQSGKHLCQVSSKSFKGFKSNRAEGKKSHMTFDP